MKIVLILPRAGIYRHGSGAYSKYLRYSPMTLPALASLVPEELNAEIEMYDEGIEEVPIHKISADIVGITGITGASRRTYAFADFFRSKGIYVVIGGVHATLLPDEAQARADTVITGQALATWPQFLFDWKAGQPKKRYTAEPGMDFSKFKVPLRKHMKYRRYVTINSIQAVFGCPNGCEFCVTPVVCSRYEMRPIEQVISDIRTMRGSNLAFVDPSPIENVRYATDLYREMIPLKKTWTGLATTRLVKHTELMDVMEQSGCRGLLIGFESLSQSANAHINKGFNKVDDYYRLVEELHRRGIAIMGCFVHGLDGDDPNCFQRTLDFVMSAKIDLPRFTVCTPFPGTPFFRRLEQEGRILTRDWALYDAQHVVFRPQGMSVEELRDGHHWIWKEAYKTGNIIKRLVGSRTFLSIAIPANIGYRIYAGSLERYTDEFMAEDHLLAQEG